MNSKKISQQKKEKHIKTNNGDNTEIFVLSPNLLEKLGIHLENVTKESSTETTIDKDIIPAIDQSYTSKDVDVISNVISCHVKSNTHNYKETSILETANLMKNSVFLSPTFQPTIANEIPGEMEIAKTYNELEKQYSNNTLELKENIESPARDQRDLRETPGEVMDNNVFHIKDSNSSEVYSNINNFKYTEDTECIKKGSKSIHNDNNNKNSKNINEQSISNISDTCLNNAEENLSTKDNPDEAYCSDSSGSNLGALPTLDILKTKIKSKSKLTNKVNILSQEILAPSQLNEIKRLHTPNSNSLIPVTINSVITCKKIFKSNNNPNTNLAIYDPIIIEVPNTNVDVEQITYNQDMKFVYKEEGSGSVIFMNTPNEDSLNPVKIKSTLTNNTSLEDLTVQEQGMIDIINEHVENECINEQELNIAYETKNIISCLSNKPPIVIDDAVINNFHSLIPVDIPVCENGNEYTSILLNDFSNVGEIELSRNKEYQLEELDISNNKLINCTEKDVIEHHILNMNLQNKAAAIEENNGNMAFGEAGSNAVFMNENNNSTLLNPLPISSEEGVIHNNKLDICQERFITEDKDLKNIVENQAAVIEIYNERERADEKYTDVVCVNNDNNSTISNINLKYKLENEAPVKEKDNEKVAVDEECANVVFMNDDSKLILPNTLLSSVQVKEIEIYDNKLIEADLMEIDNENAIIRKECMNAVFVNDNNTSKPSRSCIQLQKEEVYDNKLGISTENNINKDSTLKYNLNSEASVKESGSEDVTVGNECANVLFVNDDSKSVLPKTLSSVQEQELEINDKKLDTSTQNILTEKKEIKYNLKNEATLIKNDSEKAIFSEEFTNVVYGNDEIKLILPKLSPSSAQLQKVKMYDNKLDNCTANNATGDPPFKYKLESEVPIKKINSDKVGLESADGLFLNDENKSTLMQPLLSSENVTEHNCLITMTNVLYNENSKKIHSVSENQYTELTSDIKNTYISKKQPKSNLSDQNKKLRNQDSAHNLCYEKSNEFRKTTLSNTIESKDRIQEIASYLSQYSKILARKQKANITKQYHNNVKSKLDTNIKSGITKSKLCIQGVEKPGGSTQVLEKFRKVDMHKTYIKKVHQKQQPNIQLALKGCNKKVCENSKHDPENIDCVNMSNSASELTKQVFCLCGDFGRLAYYDFVNIYEHIHFWKHPNVNCNIDTVISIYNEDYNIINNSIVNYKEESLQLAENNCSNEINCYEEDVIQICHESFTNSNMFSEAEVIKTDGSGIVAQNVLYSENISENVLQVSKTNVEDAIMKSKDNGCGDCTDISAADISTVIEYPGNLGSIMTKGTDNSNTNSNKELTTTNLVSNENLNEIPLRDSALVSKPKNNDVEKDTLNAKGNVIKCYINKQSSTSSEYDKVVTECASSPSVDDYKLDESISKMRRKTKFLTDEDLNEKYVKCAVCYQMIADAQWENHISEEHYYIAWKVGDSFNYEDLELKNKLKQKLKSDGYLKCNHCDAKIKKIKRFLLHVKSCSNLKNYVDMSEQKNNSNIDPSPTSLPVQEIKESCEPNLEYKIEIEVLPVQNGVQSDDATTDQQDNKCEDEVNSHDYNGLDMSVEHKPKRRGRKRKAPDVEDESPRKESKNTVKCAVCGEFIVEAEWDNHISESHSYVAWKDGEHFDYADPALFNKLKEKLKCKGYLTCPYCGIKMKYTNSFLKHMHNCIEMKKATSEKQDNKSEDEVNSHDNNELDMSAEHKSKRRGRKRRKPLDVEDECPNKESKNTVKCAVCGERIVEAEWDNHISESHNYVAWKDGEHFNYEDPDLFNKLKEKLKCYGYITCLYCGIEIKYIKSFLKHVQKCIEMQNVKNEEDIVVNIKEEPLSNSELITCGVCMQDVEDHHWVEHISGQHNYLAWKHGEQPLDINDEDMIKHHLVNMVQQHGGLICVNCGMFRKYMLKTVKSFLAHIKKCVKNDSFNRTVVVEISNASINETNETQSIIQPTPVTTDDNVVSCAVCKETMPSSDWIQHLSKQHNYLAWKMGEEVPNLEDEESMKLHLYNIAKQQNGLICSNCGLVRKYVKSYLHHIKSCENDTAPTDESQYNESMNTTNILLSDLGVVGAVECAVCNVIIEEDQWITHIQRQHRYLAWVSGQPPLDLNNSEMVYNHLYAILKLAGSLSCNICGAVRKYVKSYMQHVENCISCLGSETTTLLNEEGMFVCAICSESVYPQDWKNHAMKKHYNVAWIVGGTPIDLTSTYGAEKSIKEYKERYGKLVCKTCGTTRASCMGFYAHIITCGKTDEETEMFKSMCDICNSKYLCIYKNQHMAMHREQQYAKERKQKAHEKDNEVKVSKVSNTIGQREAAVKAKTVIENYKKNSEYKYNCPHCDFGTDDERKMSDHKCDKNDLKQLSDSEFVKMDGSDDESNDSVVDSDISAEEEEAAENKKKRRGGESNASSKIPRIPFTIKDANKYMDNSFKDYTKLILTSDILFPQWQTCEYEAIPKEQCSQYLPLLKESCKVKCSSNEWVTFQQFEAKKFEDTKSIFVGGSIQCLSWVPHFAVDERDESGEFVAIVSHRGADSPRHEPDDLSVHASLIQIWGLGFLNEGDVPKFEMGIALDYGTVWAMDWCPSGTRNFLPAESSVKADNFTRMGLLAVACSNGLAYIFSVPYPSSITNSNQQIYKLKPVAEFRFVMGTDRKKYQASSICWSKQKGHTTVIVGYANGSCAHFDLNTESPLLHSVEDGVTILYPYDDERSLSSCITSISACSTAGQIGSDAVAVAGPTGAALLAPAATAPPRLQLHLAYSTVSFVPGWPSVMIAGDEAIMNQTSNELEVWGYGRRLGLMETCCGCERCGCVVAYMMPILRTMRLHASHGDINKRPLAMLRMAELNGRKRKFVKDELVLKLEPFTYESAVEKYGIELTMVNKKNKSELHQIMTNARDVFPERFPLSDVVTMAFCPSAENHRTLAVATHAGVVFFFKVC